MKYFEAKFTIKPYDEVAADVLTALLGESGFEAFLPTEDGLLGYVQQQDYNEEETQRIASTFGQHIVNYTIREAPEEDWNQTWEQEGFEPIAVDDLVCVHDTNHTEVPPCRYDIVINPRMAFGTGTHPTTRQILRQLCNMDLSGRRIVDAGCGTGVLGILSAMRGANHVFSYDIDSWSVENTLTNVALNRVEGFDVREGDASVLPQDASYDLVIANINRNILLQDMNRFVGALKTGGQLLLSGFYEEDIPMLEEKGHGMGLRIEKKGIAEGWAMLLLRLVDIGL